MVIYELLSEPNKPEHKTCPITDGLRKRSKPTQIEDADI